MIQYKLKKGTKYLKSSGRETNDVNTGECMHRKKKYLTKLPIILFLSPKMQHNFHTTQVPEVHQRLKVSL